MTNVRVLDVDAFAQQLHEHDDVERLVAAVLRDRVLEQAVEQLGAIAHVQVEIATQLVTNICFVFVLFML